MTNMTYVQALEIAIDIVDNEEAMEKLNALKEQLMKRSSSKTPTKTQKENEGIMEVIINVLAEMSEPSTVTELITCNKGLENYSNQKISALLKKLVDNGRVEKTIDGKKAKFSLID